VDIATLAGMILGVLLLVGSIALGGALEAFVDLPSVLIVFGGTIACTFTMERMDNVIGSFRVAKNAIMQKDIDVISTIQLVLKLAATARREGLLELEKAKITDEFLSKGVRMAVDGMTKEQVHEVLGVEMLALRERHVRGQKLFKFMGTTAPAMGMIGTLIGLVKMLRTLDDPSTIGPSMAIALLTTFYGAVMAFVFFNPIAAKLEQRTKDETARMRIVIDGVGGIITGQNPALIQEKLEAHLAPKQRGIKRPGR
jgi:chemotaxis protein MotA